MDQLKWTTPIKNGKKRDSIAMKSPIMYKTPVKQYDTISSQGKYQNNMGGLSVLPSHITPPSRLTEFMARNPFETDLTSRLHLSVISPTVFSKVSSPSQQSPEFTWSVDELATMHPARIEEFPIQQLHCIDQEAEMKAQAAIDKFFKENQIIPSPWETKKKDIKLKAETDTPTRASDDMCSLPAKSRKDGWSQTVLSLPVDLPEHVTEALKPYFTFTQEQNTETDDANSSNNSLRRKLFFNHNDSLQNDDESSNSLSPVKMNGSLILSSSHPQSGMLIDGIPIQDSDNRIVASQRKPENLSPPNISPIFKGTNNMSSENLRSRTRSVTRLDFTAEMNEEQSSMQCNDDSIDQSLDLSFNKPKMSVSDCKIDKLINFDNDSTYVQINNVNETKNIVTNSTYFDKNFDAGESVFIFKDQNDVHISNKLGISDQQSVSNSVQDTGYQTYTTSDSSTTNITNNSNNTLSKQKMYFCDPILTTDDEIHLSDWKGNMKNVFSSTPSKSKREKDNQIF